VQQRLTTETSNTVDFDRTEAGVCLRAPKAVSVFNGACRACVYFSYFIFHGLLSFLL
jgi:hypothetical protein